MRADVLVYLAGPLTGQRDTTIEAHVAAAVKVFLDLIALGVPAFCPHLPGAFPSAWTAVPYEAWLAYDLVLLDRCTHLLLLPRWETSGGARRERAHAEAKGLPVFDSVPRLLAALAARSETRQAGC